ncbi:hypothetical protein D5H75_00600 [Bailinhaonella thermotolerans]|uniref:Uncharacterized protein n=2 Tax=Bailinhaonella thermotolerans TaxID=1070861 RepID=A0A3A4B2I0_9ACTN|nr:hypothetical protein D5H75_00600 [Bailinhaonella thermotolerans]
MYTMISASAATVPPAPPEPVSGGPQGDQQAHGGLGDHPGHHGHEEFRQAHEASRAATYPVTRGLVLPRGAAAPSGRRTFRVRPRIGAMTAPAAI